MGSRDEEGERAGEDGPRAAGGGNEPRRRREWMTECLWGTRLLVTESRGRSPKTRLGGAPRGRGVGRTRALSSKKPSGSLPGRWQPVTSNAQIGGPTETSLLTPG